MIRAFEAELAARHAIAELAGSDEHMLRDIGITRNEIESVVRGFRARDDGPILSSDTCQSRAALPDDQFSRPHARRTARASVAETTVVVIAARQKSRLRSCNPTLRRYERPANKELQSVRRISCGDLKLKWHSLF
jgi:uncharacterized protein YjiS (DUF1127 family)